MIKLFLLCTVRFILSFFKIFRLQAKQCFFMSYAGTQYSCNPRAIYEYLDKKKEGFVFVWAVNDNINVKSVSENNSLILVTPNTLKYYFYLITSKYVFTNIQLSTFIPKKKNSVWVNTWHGGGAFKKVEYPSINVYAKITKKLQCKQTDIYISSSRIFTDVMSASSEIPKSKFLEIGMPRNDVFFADFNIRSEISKKVRTFYNLKKDDFIVLYAPTYRGSASHGDFDMELDIAMIKSAFENRFSRNVVFFIRAHHAVKNHNNLKDNVCIDVTSYPDMQDLEVAADALITDYSSCIYDFALTRKPGFLFTPDIEKYRIERGFYTDVSEWPYNFAESNQKFLEMIDEFDKSTFLLKNKEYLRKINSFDKGTATKKLLDYININGEKH